MRPGICRGKKGLPHCGGEERVRAAMMREITLDALASCQADGASLIATINHVFLSRVGLVGGGT